MSEIWAIVLAAGESKRMKTPKMLLPFQGKTMIETVIYNILIAGIENVIVVLGSGSDEILLVTGKLPVVHCHNENFKEGMLSSVKKGFSCLPGSFDAVLVFPGDQPLISPTTTRMIISEYYKSGKGIVTPSFENKRGHPVLIDRKYRKDVEILDEKNGLRSLALEFHDDVLEVFTGDPGILKDFDTPEEYLNEVIKHK